MTSCNTGHGGFKKMVKNCFVLFFFQNVSFIVFTVSVSTCPFCRLSSSSTLSSGRISENHQKWSAVFVWPSASASYSGHPHDHLVVGTVEVVGSQLAEDVQKSVSTVLVQNSPDVAARPRPGVGAAVRRVPVDALGSFTAGAQRVL